MATKNNEISCVQCRFGRGLPPYQVTSWSIQPFGHNRHWPKIGGYAAFFLGGGQLGPHLAQCGRGRGLPPCQWFHLDPSNRLAIMHQRHIQDRQTDRQDRHTRQRSSRIGRTVLQTVSQKSLTTLGGIFVPVISAIVVAITQPRTRNAVPSGRLTLAVHLSTRTAEIRWLNKQIHHVLSSNYEYARQ